MVPFSVTTVPIVLYISYLGCTKLYYLIFLRLKLVNLLLCIKMCYNMTLGFSVKDSNMSLLLLYKCNKYVNMRTCTVCPFLLLLMKYAEEGAARLHSPNFIIIISIIL